jgi:hypothetical protein
MVWLPFLHCTSLCISCDKNLEEFLMLCSVLWASCFSFLSIKIYVCTWVDLLFVNNFNSNQVAKVKFILLLFSFFFFWTLQSSDLCFFFFFSNNVGDQLGVFIQHTLVARVKLCFLVIWKHAIPFQICSEQGYIHLWFHKCSETLSRPITYTLYYDTASSFCTNEF